MNFIKPSKEFTAKRFGFTWITDLTALEKYIKNINVYVIYYSYDVYDSKLIESPLYLLNKNLLNEMKTIYSTEFVKPKKIKKFTPKEAFKIANNELKIKYIFPNTIFNYYYYTDNRTVIPKEFLQVPKLKNSNQKQLTLF
ncbi:hypothetical protein [Arcobacter aquimarinus]|uniref:hypothetical protein n=1 Tax=Arcobacter aquimarinus TaxID=1315211 RepID=UPI003BB02D67